MAPQLATPQLASIQRYPVKGLSAEPVERVTLRSGMALPGDRRYALAYGSSRIAGAATPWRPKRDFITLLREERLAQLDTRVEGAEDRLIIVREGRQLLSAALSDPLGRTLASQFFAAFLGEAARGVPKLTAAEPGASLSDNQVPLISLINLVSVSDLSRLTGGRRVNPLRFRGNLHLEGLAPWEERAWQGRRLRIGSGEDGAVLEVVEPIVRCAATDVDPETGQRDMNLPQILHRGLGAPVCGVYARVVTGGEITRGMALRLLD